MKRMRILAGAAMLAGAAAWVLLGGAPGPEARFEKGRALLEDRLETWRGRVEQARIALERFAAGAPPARYAQDIAKARAFLERVR